MHMTVAPFLSLLLLAPAIDGWLGIYLDNEAVQAVIGEVIPESPAARAGLRAGDVLLAVGDLATGTRESFIAAVRAALAALPGVSAVHDLHVWAIAPHAAISIKPLANAASTAD